MLQYGLLAEGDRRTDIFVLSSSKTCACLFSKVTEAVDGLLVYSDKLNNQISKYIKFNTFVIRFMTHLSFLSSVTEYSARILCAIEYDKYLHIV